MAARTKKIRHSEEVRNKIQAHRLIDELQKFVYGERQMEGAQVTAALGLLRKTLPDMQAVEHSGEVTNTYVARIPQVAETVQQWIENQSGISGKAH